MDNGKQSPGGGEISELSELDNIQASPGQTPSGVDYEIGGTGKAIRFKHVGAWLNRAEWETLLIIGMLTATGSISNTIRHLIAEEGKRHGVWPPPPSETLNDFVINKMMERRRLIDKARQRVKDDNGR